MAPVTDLERRYVAYQLLDDALYAGYESTTRRAALERLRHLIGPDAYHGGRMPLHVDVAVFRWRE